MDTSIYLAFIPAAIVIILALVTKKRIFPCVSASTLVQ